MANHFKSGSSVSSFVEKLEQASTTTIQGVTGNYRSGLSVVLSCVEARLWAVT
jgi:hypothetical protein